MVDGIEWDELDEKKDLDTRVFASALSADGMGSNFPVYEQRFILHF